ncbi:asparagine synthase-related protein [Rhizorhabdus sp. FW153]|uniref:asparagine synthase-related protein n=1 Tax=Rhizorhabdus sp. FW153 TaxID=3400216 RepID=UPI003CE953C3
MSDFAGLWRFDDRSVAQSDLKRMAAGLDGHNVGPSRFWHDGAIGLVHRQHVFTPEDLAERMPLVGLSGNRLVADCRLNNRRELARQLGLENGSSPDGALILAAFDRWGPDCVSRLLGDFAAAIWEPAGRRLVLLRDHCGSRTLYLHRNERFVAFSTRLCALLALPDIPRDLDDAAIADHLILNLGPPTRTLYRAITRVPIAHLAIVTRETVRLSRHWQSPEPGSLTRPSDKAYEEEGRYILDQAVGDALRARGPVTQLLTAGLDSAAIVESAARQLAPGRHLAMTKIPSGAIAEATADRYHDESPRARLLAGHLPSLDWHGVASDEREQDDLDPFRAYVMGGKPSRAPQNVAWFYPIYRHMARLGSNVSLGGELGNTYFSENGLAFLPMMLTGLRWASLAREIRALSQVEGRSAWQVTKRALRPLEPLAWRMRRVQSSSEPWASHSAINPQFAADLRLGEALDVGRYRMRTGGGHRSITALRAWVWEDEVARDDETIRRAVTGIDHRLPLADRRVVDFFGALPPDQFLRNGETRSIARRLLRGRLPPEIVESRARGVQNGDWFRILKAHRPAMLADLAQLRTKPLASRVVDLDRLQSLLETWPSDLVSAQRQRAQYLQMLTRGLEMARFLAWHEGGNS